MTYKFVGALRSLTDDKPYQRTAIWIGVVDRLRDRAAAQDHQVARGVQEVRQGEARSGFSTDFVLDAVVLPSPYASSFGGFVNLLDLGVVRRRRRVGELHQQLAESARTSPPRCPRT